MMDRFEIIQGKYGLELHDKNMEYLGIRLDSCNAPYSFVEELNEYFAAFGFDMSKYDIFDEDEYSIIKNDLTNHLKRLGFKDIGVRVDSRYITVFQYKDSPLKPDIATILSTTLFSEILDIDETTIEQAHNTNYYAFYIPIGQFRFR